MKVLAIILSGLVLQTSASFFDELRGAVSSVESSFGKLLNDVIYDVKETIDCTLMAVEQVLALGVFRDPSDYEAKCKGAAEAVAQPPPPPPPPVVVATNPPPPAPETPHIEIPLTKTEHRQVDSSILNVDQVLCDVLKKEDTHAQLETVKLALINETERLTEISELLKKQLEELSAEVKEKFKAIELQTSAPSVESIWNDIKLLHEIEHRHRNTDEAKKISRVLDQILNILDANEEDRSAADDNKIQEIMRKLSKKAKGGDSDIWTDLKNYPKDFREYAKRVFDENRSTFPPDETSKPSEPEDVTKKDAGKTDEKEDQTKTTNEPDNTEDQCEHSNETDKKDNQTEKPKEVTTVKPKSKKRKLKRTTTTTTERLLTVEELAAQYGSLFDVMPDIDSIEHKKAIDSAKSIIQESKLNDEVINSLAEMESSKDARDLFDDPDLLGDFKG
ncbi:FK506-binding protein 5-like [Leguminivora glycinivorella]|uniref:FK506-binding protein 5-like n=1 Tax=Leguminivora glycinivorella TaxID=1035111 RepID=UPI00200C7C13|nr:FK506-binding protein 5-like [Leguminivora glycinivorella]